ncbi:MAG TPA: hypothetical protein DDY38_01515 [Firmicutes bacterium]|nr:hypothetical protein [Bacillota bacterium]
MSRVWALAAIAGITNRWQCILPGRGQTEKAGAETAPPSCKVQPGLAVFLQDAVHIYTGQIR